MLAYHRVVDPGPDDLAARAAGEGPPPGRRLLVTRDDGRRDTHAALPPGERR